MTDIVDRLRYNVSGPHKRGREYTASVGLEGRILIEAADEIERLRGVCSDLDGALRYLRYMDCYMNGRASANAQGMAQGARSIEKTELGV